MSFYLAWDGGAGRAGARAGHDEQGCVTVGDQTALVARVRLQHAVGRYVVILRAPASIELYDGFRNYLKLVLSIGRYVGTLATCKYTII
jgi:hypothetical protein